MQFFLPASRWLGLRLLLGLTIWAGLGQSAAAQRASHRAAAKAARPAPAHPRLDAELQRLAAQAGAGTASVRELRASFPQLSFGGPVGRPAVLVRVTARDVAVLLPQLQSRGFEVSSSYPKLHFVEGMLPVSQLAAADALAGSGLLGIVAAAAGEGNGGLVTSQADDLLETARARATRPRQVTGAGVTIGVLSDSFDYLGGAATDVASGDLPAGVNVLTDNGTADEGRAMCQLIYDLAPGSPLAFSTARGGEGVLAQHIRDLANPARGNCKVIVDDWRYFAEPFFQDGVIAQAITDVVSNQGVTYFSSAGNYADKSYENAAPQFVANANGVRCLNFDPSGATTDLTQRVTIANGGTFQPYLQWSDPFYTTNGVHTDLDIYLLAVRSNGIVDTVYRGNTRNLLNQNPLESAYYSNATATSGTTAFDLVVVWKAGTAPTRLKYVNYGSASPAEWLTGSSTSTGHTAAFEAFSVAAVPYYNQRVPETFTSKGGAMTFLFAPTGAALSAPVTRQKPNIASIDGANNTFFGSDYEPDGFPNFFGTSAAAPHAAAVAALLRSAEPALTPAQVYRRLVGSARLLGTSNTDPLTGPGLLDAFTALYGPVVAATPPVAEDLEKGALPVAWSVNGYGAARAQVSGLAPASGVQSLLLDAYPTITSLYSLNEVTLALQSASATDLRLTFRERKFVAETDELMPTQFAGRSNTDGVALSVDGGNVWYRLVALNRTAAPTTYQTQTVDLTAFATANGLTLGNDIRIRFQQYGRGGATAANPANRAGRAFDDIVVGGRTPAPAPLYTYSQPTSGCPGLQVQFTDSSLFRPTSRLWTFAGGSPATSTLPNPSVTYAAPGRYAVTLSVTNAAGTAARTDTSVVLVYGRAPVAAIGSTAPSVCRGGAVTFSSTSQFCPSTYSWSFPGGSPATSTAAAPAAVTYATAGNYTATLTVTNAYGTSTTSQIVDVDGRPAASFAENFNASPTLPRGWALVAAPSTYSWVLANGVVGPTGATSRALRAPFFDDPNRGDYFAVYTPALNLSYAGATAHTLRFDLAYRPYASVPGAQTIDNDSLIVQVADACTGAILGRPYAKSALTTLPTGASVPTFVPVPADWRQETVSLAPYLGHSVVVRFVARNDYGNNLYLDNVQVSDGPLALTSAAARVGFDAWPNPTPRGTALTVRLPAATGPASLRLLDALGRVVWQEQVPQTGAAVERTLRPGLAPGLYSLLYVPAGGTPAARRLVLE